MQQHDWDRAKLYNLMNKHLSKSDLNSLCFLLGLDRDDFPEAKGDMILSLIRRVEQLRLQTELVTHLLRMRPDVGRLLVLNEAQRSALEGVAEGVGRPEDDPRETRLPGPRRFFQPGALWSVVAFILLASAILFGLNQTRINGPYSQADALVLKDEPPRPSAQVPPGPSLVPIVALASASATVVALTTTPTPSSTQTSTPIPTTTSTSTSTLMPTPRPQFVRWDNNNPRYGVGLCIDPVGAECTEFIAWSDLRLELRDKVFPQVTTYVRGDSDLIVADQPGFRNSLVQVVSKDNPRNRIGDVWLGRDPNKDWNPDGLVRLGKAAPPIYTVWITLQRYSDGSYRRK